MIEKLSDTSESVLQRPSLRSFRDPDGQLIVVDGRFVRCVRASGAAHLAAFLASQTAGALVQERRLVATTMLAHNEAEDLLREIAGASALDALENPAMVVEHEPVALPSFPYEWPPEMLHAAAALTLDLAERLLADSFGLKDATPYNVLFRGTDPVFVDVLSVERRAPRDATWLPYAQFTRTFLLPLLVNKYFGVPLNQLLATRRDGLEPEEVYRLCGPLRRILPPFLTLASLPTWLGARQDRADATIYQRAGTASPAKAQFILRSLFQGLRRTLQALEPSGNRRSVWSGYMTSKSHYAPEQFEAKQSFVSDALATCRPRRVLDIGCNTGHFSAMAAHAGARVVAIDTDPVVVGQAWRVAQADRCDVLPLVIDLARPSPAIGWRNEECASFLDRARGAADCVFLLAMMHHLLVSERIPLKEILRLVADLTTDAALIEFVAPDDPMFRRLTRGREALFSGLTVEVFEVACRRQFTIVRSQRVSAASRWLYLLRKKEDAREKR